jgi:hypothetical protein
MAVCPHCGAAFEVTDVEVAEAGLGGRVICHSPSCAAIISVKGRTTSISVDGSNAQEVSDVVQRLSGQATARREAARLRSPWFSGFFYIILLIVVIVLLLVVGRACQTGLCRSSSSVRSCWSPSLARFRCARTSV